MNRRRIIYILIALFLIIGNGLLFNTWVMPPEKVESQCTLVYLDSSSGVPPCTGGTRISYTQSSVNSSYSATYYLGLCMQ